MLYAYCRVHATEKAAGDGCQLLGAGEAVLAGERFPGGVGEWIGYPHVTVVGVVFYQEEATAGAQVAAYELEHGVLFAEEVQRVGHDYAVERWQVETLGEIGVEVVDGGGGKLCAHGFFLVAKCA